METLFNAESMPPCARILPGGKCEAVCGNFDRFLREQQLGYAPISNDPKLIKLEVNEFTKRCFIKFVESGLCSYLICLKQEELGAASGVPSASNFKYGQCVGLEAHVTASKN